MSSMGERDNTSEQSIPEDVDVSETGRGTKRPRERSVVWQFFTKNCIPGSDTIYNTVSCNYCSTILKCTLANGTSCCRNHAKRCKHNPFTEIDNTQTTLAFGKSDNDEKEKLLAWKFDQEISRASLAKMIILDELPFATVEREGFKRFVMTLQPKFKIMLSRVTVARDCFQLYSIELLKLKDFMKNNVQRVSLTTDLWTSVQNRSYLCLTAHFIDAQWNLHKRIINFCPIDDHTGDSIGKLIEFCLKNWGIERIFTITVDNASANDVGIAYLKRKLIARNNAVLGGKYLHVRCCAHILNLIVKDGLKECDLAVKRIRGAVRFIRSSPKRAMQFSKCVAQENLLGANKGASVDLDVSTRWNSTYLMLSAALKFQKPFSKMVVEDMFEDLTDGPPTDEDWEQVTIFVKFLGVFFNCTKNLSGTLYVTSSQYFQEVCTVKMAIMEWGKNGDQKMRLMSCRMMKKFEKYWESLDKTNLMLMVAGILDPRSKILKLKFLADKVKRHGESLDLLELTQEALKSLFEFYSIGNESSNSVGVVGIEEEVDKPDERGNKGWEWEVEYEKSLENIQEEDGRTELERYLAVKTVKNDANFSILDWWKLNACEYPILSAMAKDILAIPVSTVASESAFSTGSRVLDAFRSSLTPKTVECLICTQSWLQGSPLISVEESFETLDEIEESVITTDDVDLYY